MTELPISKWKLANTKTFRMKFTDTPWQVNKVEDDEREEYNEGEYRRLVGSKAEKTLTNTTQNTEPISLIYEAIIRYQQTKRKTKLIAILQYVKSCVDFTARKQDIMNRCKVQIFTDYTRWEIKRHNRYRLLVSVGSDRYTINPLFNQEWPNWVTML